MGLIRTLEAVLSRAPAKLRRAIADRWPLRPVLNAALVARR